ncbi:MAG: antitoxin Xre/MbcA/ParS toxin-binding domain-containing protein [Terriglobales bacterium]
MSLDWIRKRNRRFKSTDNTILGHLKKSGKHLVAEVNSEKRAQRLRNEIEKRLGSLAVHESTVAQTLEQMRKNLPAGETSEAESLDPEFEAMMRDPEGQQQLQATVQKQVEAWIHEKIPVLGGRTPIEAIRDPHGREAVEALVLHWERREERHVSPNEIRPDISALRHSLNLGPRVS